MLLLHLAQMSWRLDLMLHKSCAFNTNCKTISLCVEFPSFAMLQVHCYQLEVLVCFKSDTVSAPLVQTSFSLVGKEIDHPETCVCGNLISELPTLYFVSFINLKSSKFLFAIFTSMYFPRISSALHIFKSFQISPG